METVLGFQTNGDFFGSLFVLVVDAVVAATAAGARRRFDSTKHKSTESNPLLWYHEQVVLPVEDSNCGDTDDASGWDDETFSSSETNR